MTKIRLGDQLLKNGLITQDQIEIAITEQRKTDLPLGQLFVDLGFVTEAIVRDMLSEAQGHESIDLSKVVPDPDAIKLVPKNIALRSLSLPIRYDHEEHLLELATTDLYNVVTLDRIRSLLPETVTLKPILASESDLRKALDTFYGYELSVDGILKEIETGIVDHQSIEQQSSEEYDQPLVRLVNAILTDAVKRDASDIHFNPEHGFLRLRYRIDGVLRQIRSLHKDYWSAIAVRLKVMADLNIAETRTPQDGRISLKVGGKPIDFRVSVQPTTNGENIVLRILDRSKGIVPLDDLNLFEENLELLKLIMSRPEGIILVTGPTGSGKTTTLYSMLNHRKSIEVNIMTLEDPVEYPIDLIRQTSISDSAKMDFASGIKALMRQDPDIILVGEVRDEETAEMAFRAAMTGHQVFTTLHTNSALGAISRLTDIGIKPHILSGNIIGVVGQRLVRKLCTHCKTERPAEEYEKIILDAPEITTLYDAKGCDKCNNTGFKGRLSLIEILKLNEEIDELIAHKATIKELKDATDKSGFRPMVEDGVRRVLAGQTTLEEVGRVIDLTDRLK